MEQISKAPFSQLVTPGVQRRAPIPPSAKIKSPNDILTRRLRTANAANCPTSLVPFFRGWNPAAKLHLDKSPAHFPPSGASETAAEPAGTSRFPSFCWPVLCWPVLVPVPNRKVIFGGRRRPWNHAAARGHQTRLIWAQVSDFFSKGVPQIWRPAFVSGASHTKRLMT